MPASTSMIQSRWRPLACMTALGLAISSLTSPSIASAIDTQQSRADFDPDTGRDLLNYPPHRQVDIRHLRLEITVPDMASPRLVCREVLEFTPIVSSLSLLVLDAADLNVASVSCPSRTVDYQVVPAEQKLEIRLDPPIPAGESGSVEIRYEVVDPAEGVVWTIPNSGAPSSGDQPMGRASFHTQGEPESNRYWFACCDFPTERFTSQIIATVPRGFTACSNGRLVQHEKSAAGEVFHFSQDREHAPYLVSLAVGQLEVTDVSTFGSRLPMPVYAPAGQSSRVRAVFGRTPKMIALFERLWDEPYPWSKYAQVVVDNFAWGGMENTSATNLYESVVLDKTAELDGNEDELISHELAHQWFGDLVTCRSWEHIWLNEGWATYAEALWAQYGASSIPSSRTGSDPADPTAGLRADDEAYQYQVWQDFRQTIEDDRGEAPFQPAMVSKIYSHPEEVFDRKANPYPKGAAILHMLRRKMGDRAFFHGAAGFLNQHAGQPVETYQFRKAMEHASGQSLQRFFDQWCYRPGVPRLAVTPVWDSQANCLNVLVEQLQKIDGDNPAFAFDLQIALGVPGSSAPTIVSRFTESKSASWTIPCPRQPEYIAVNPDLGVLAEIELRTDPSMLHAILERGPTPASRLDAAHAIAERGDSDANGFSLLAAEALDRGNPESLRKECLRALGKAGAVDAIMDMAKHAPASAPFLSTWATQFGECADAMTESQRSEAASTLRAIWSKERSYGVRAACLESIGALIAAQPALWDDCAETLHKGLATESQHDQIRQAAIKAFAKSNRGEALDLVLPFAAPSRPAETRQAAVHAAADLAAHDPDRVLNILTAVSSRSDVRTRREALECLLALNDPRARAVVEQFAATTRSRADRTWANTKLREATSAPPAEASADSVRQP